MNTSKKKEFESELRNKLTLPLTVLNSLLEDKDVSKDIIKMAIEDLSGILKEPE